MAIPFSTAFSNAFSNSGTFGPFTNDFSPVFAVVGTIGPFTDEFSPEFGNGAFLASGRAVPRGTGVPQFSVGQPATQVRASGFAIPRGRATLATGAISVAASGLSFPRSSANGASQFTLGLWGAAQAFGSASAPTVIGNPWSLVFTADFGPLAITSVSNVSARGVAIPRGFVQRATAVAARGTARPTSAAGAAAFGGVGGVSPFAIQFSLDFGAGTAIPISLAAWGTAALRGRASEAFGLFGIRGFARPRGRVNAVVRPLPLAARGMARPRGTARDTIQAQQIIIPGAPPPLTIWQRLAAVTPSHEMHEKPRVLRQTFGDGYGQTVPDGLTPIVRTLTLTWENVDKTEADNIIRFLQDYIGVPISFVAPRENSPRKWLAKDWRRTSPQPNADNITVTFEDRPYVELILGL